MHKQSENNGEGVIPQVKNVVSESGIGITLSDLFNQDKESTKPILFEDVKRALPSDAILEKHFYDKDLDLIMKACMLSEVQENRLRKHTGRARFHVIRMLRRSDIERKFSLAYMEYHDDIFQNDKENEAMMHSVISSEGIDTKMFWTFAPYIFRSLIQNEVLERDAIKKILFWGKEGTSHKKEYGYGLIGTHHYGRTWVLSEDENDISHIYTAQESEKIAHILQICNSIEEYVYNPDIWLKQ